MYSHKSIKNSHRHTTHIKNHTIQASPQHLKDRHRYNTTNTTTHIPTFLSFKIFIITLNILIAYSIYFTVDYHHSLYKFHYRRTFHQIIANLTFH